MAQVEVRSIWFDEMPFSWAEKKGIIRKNIYDMPTQRFDFAIGQNNYSFRGGPTVNGYMVFSAKSADTTIVPTTVAGGGGRVRRHVY
jgi:hypothetical protein